MRESGLIVSGKAEEKAGLASISSRSFVSKKEEQYTVVELMCTAEHSRPFATSKAAMMSFDQTLELRPYWDELATLTAWSASRARMTERTGPNDSSE